LVGKRGKKRAIVAVGHTILVIAYHLIKEKKHFVELGADYVDEKKRKAQLKYYQKRIEELGAAISENKSA
jgi:prefoldin subunit 5